MERIRNVSTQIHRFWRDVIEWKSSASAPYLMVVNGVFWSTVFYADYTLKLRLLLSLAAGVFGSDILLSPSNDTSVGMHIISWPIHSLWRTCSVVLSLASAHYLRKEELEIACWSAYGTVGCLIINPVWAANDVNTKMLNAGKSCAHQMASWTDKFVLSPLSSVWAAIKYVVLLQFVPPLCQYVVSVFKSIGQSIKSMWQSLCNSVYSYVILPCWNAIKAVGAFFRYWLCAHWWPDLKLWLKAKVGEPLKRLFNYVCFCLVYVVCGHWIPPLCGWIKAKLLVFGGFLYRTIVDPSKRWLLARCDELRIWLRAKLHQLAIAIRDSVLWPICLLVVNVAKDVCVLVYNVAIQPVLHYFYQRYKIAETAALIYILGPFCEKVVNNIPEKNPFCDDSDVELEGMLPTDVDENPEVSLTDRSNTASVAGSLIDDEERDFVAGLQFPTIHASESSDEEFDLHKKRTENLRNRKKTKRRSPSNKTSRSGPASPDDEFELLQ